MERQHCSVTSAVAPVTCAWTRERLDHAYTATALVLDRRGRPNVTQYDIPWFASENNAPLRLTPDRASYRPGDVAKIEIVSDVVPATAIVSFARDGVFAQKRVELTAASTTVELPIEPAFIANVHVDVDRMAKRRVMRPGSKIVLPEVTHASLELPVSIESARLVMTARPSSKIVEPGAEATFDVDVHRDGKPVADAEVALLVVDEAILALSSRTFEDPLPNFYHAVGDGTFELSTLDMGPIAATSSRAIPASRATSPTRFTARAAV